MFKNKESSLTLRAKATNWGYKEDTLLLGILAREAFYSDTYYSLRLMAPTNGCTIFHSSLTWWAKRGPLSIKAFLKRFYTKKAIILRGPFQNVQTVYARRRRAK
jgi:hypothetical protein